METLCAATKTLCEVEGSLRDRFAFLRLKYDPLKDPEFEKYAAEQLNSVELDHHGSSSLSAMQQQYLMQRRDFSLEAYAKQTSTGGKIGAKGGGGKTPSPKLEPHPEPPQKADTGKK